MVCFLLFAFCSLPVFAVFAAFGLCPCLHQTFIGADVDARRPASLFLGLVGLLLALVGIHARGQLLQAYHQFFVVCSVRRKVRYVS